MLELIMCEFCTRHGDGKIWYKNASNYGGDLLSDLNRRRYIETFLASAFREGFQALGRLEAIYSKRGRLPEAVKTALAQKAKTEHFGQVLPMEEIRELVLKAATIVRMPCACRWDISRREVRSCYAVSYGPEPWYERIDMGYFGELQDQGLEGLSREAAIAQMEELEGQGAVHTIWTMMTPFIGAICNCTVEECLGLRTLDRVGVQTFARAEFAAKVDEAVCSGCGLCEGACQFRAIDAIRTGGRSVSRIDPLRCFGCGLCRNACAAGALSLVPR